MMSNTVSRRELEGVAITQENSTANGEEIVGMLVIKEEVVLLKLFLSKNAPQGEFLIKEIYDSKNLLLWSAWRDLDEYFFGLTKLRPMKDDCEISIEEYGMSAKTIRVSDLLMKRNSDKHFTRKLKSQELMRRPQITVYNSDGFKLYGLPVVGDEWKYLMDNGWGDVRVILVELYNHVTKEASYPVEAFIVSKERNKPCQRTEGIPNLSFEKPKGKASWKPEWLHEMKAVVKLDGIAISIPYYPNSKGNFQRIAAEASGDFFAAGKPDDKGCVLVYKRGDNGFDLVGSFLPAIA